MSMHQICNGDGTGNFPLVVNNDGSINIGEGNTKIVDSNGDELAITATNEALVAFHPNNGHLDAFGRLRISNPLTIFDSKQIFDAQPFFWDDQATSGGGTSSTHSANTASSVIGVSASTAGVRVRQTFRRFNYQPGKSQLILMTGVLQKSGGGTGITRRIGYFDANNGLYLEDAEGTINLVRRTKVTGSVVNNATPQSNWNMDKMDGTGLSGITLNFTKAQIFVVDFEWLGVGRVRFGFVVDGVIYYCHQLLNANNLSVVYMSTPNLPVRYEITNSGTGGEATLEHICCSVISEGGIENTGILRHTDNASVSGLATGTVYGLIGIRLKSANVGATILIESISVIATSTNDQLHWELKWKPTVAGTFNYADQTNSSVQIASGVVSNTITGGTDIDGGYLTTSLPQTPPIKNALLLGSAIDGTQDTIVLCVKPITNNITVQVSMTWRELN